MLYCILSHNGNGVEEVMIISILSGCTLNGHSLQLTGRERGGLGHRSYSNEGDDTSAIPWGIHCGAAKIFGRA